MLPGRSNGKDQWGGKERDKKLGPRSRFGGGNSSFEAVHSPPTSPPLGSSPPALGSPASSPPIGSDWSSPDIASLHSNSSPLSEALMGLRSGEWKSEHSQSHESPLVLLPHEGGMGNHHGSPGLEYGGIVFELPD